MRFDRLGHLIRMPVKLGGVDCRFLFDTGIGVNVVSPELAERMQLREVGQSFVGRRMSGQQVEAPLVHLPPVHVDGQVLTARWPPWSTWGRATRPRTSAGSSA